MSNTRKLYRAPTRHAMDEALHMAATYRRHRVAQAAATAPVGPPHDPVCEAIIERLHALVGWQTATGAWRLPADVQRALRPVVEPHTCHIPGSTGRFCAGCGR